MILETVYLTGKQSNNFMNQYTDKNMDRRTDLRTEHRCGCKNIEKDECVNIYG